VAWNFVQLNFETCFVKWNFVPLDSDPLDCEPSSFGFESSDFAPFAPNGLDPSDLVRFDYAMVLELTADSFAAERFDC